MYYAVYGIRSLNECVYILCAFIIDGHLYCMCNNSKYVCVLRDTARDSIPIDVCYDIDSGCGS